MLIPRIIPCLLLDENSMVKTRKFKKKSYLGDPINIINLFNQFEVDEIVLLDISATSNSNGPNFEVISSLADECWVPLTYGGGIKTINDIEKIILSGIEKVVIGQSAVKDLNIISSAAREFGNQCVVGSIDMKKKILGGYEVRTFNARKKIKINPIEYVKQLEDAGAGEILLQSVDRDGEMNGYDLEMIAMITDVVDIPVVACGGAANRENLSDPIFKSGASASAAGSIFVFSGQERGVLINYPERDWLESLLDKKKYN